MIIKVKKLNTKGIALGAMTAALYVILTIVSAVFGLSSSAVQIRLSEMLAILPCFSPYCIFGLTLGCFIANALTGSVFLDVIFGSIATLLGALGTYCFRKNKHIAILCPIISNTVIIPIVLLYAYSLKNTLWYFVLTVGTGELISCGLLGTLLYKKISSANILKYFNRRL